MTWTGPCKNPMQKPKSHRVEEVEPGIWRYSDDALRYYGHPDKHNGACYRLAPGMKAFTTESSKLALKKRAEIKKAKKQEAQEAIERELMKKLKTKSGALAIAKMAGSLAAGVVSDKHPLQARSATFKTIATAGGYLQERSGATQATQVNITLGVEAAAALRDLGVDIIEVEQIGDGKL